MGFIDDRVCFHTINICICLELKSLLPWCNSNAWLIKKCDRQFLSSSSERKVTPTWSCSWDWEAETLKNSRAQFTESEIGNSFSLIHQENNGWMDGSCCNKTYHCWVVIHWSRKQEKTIMFYPPAVPVLSCPPSPQNLYLFIKFHVTTPLSIVPISQLFILFLDPSSSVLFSSVRKSKILNYFYFRNPDVFISLPRGYDT